MQLYAYFGGRGKHPAYLVSFIHRRYNRCNFPPTYRRRFDCNPANEFAGWQRKRIETRFNVFARSVPADEFIHRLRGA